MTAEVAGGHKVWLTTITDKEKWIRLLRIMMTAGGEAPGGEDLYTALSAGDETNRSFTWTCPAGVTSVSVVCMVEAVRVVITDRPRHWRRRWCCITLQKQHFSNTGPNYEVHVGASRNNTSGGQLVQIK